MYLYYLQKRNEHQLFGYLVLLNSDQNDWSLFIHYFRYVMSANKLSYSVQVQKEKY